MRIIFKHYSDTKWENRKRDLFQNLINPEYLEWQQNILERLYSGVEIATLYDHRYPAAILRSSLVMSYPFKKLCKLQEVKLPSIRVKRKQKAFLKLLGNSLRWPDMKGFALKKIWLDETGLVKVIDAITITFRQNVITTHILEWELFRLYQKKRRKTISDEELLKYLPMRAIYHDKRLGQLSVLEPKSAFPLISLQALVVFRDYRDPGAPKWRIVIARRSEDVIAKPGFLQFQPAGGFEVYGSESDDDEYLVLEGFDIMLALMREYAEELFNAKHLQVRMDGRDPLSVLAEPNVQLWILRSMLTPLIR